MSEPLVEMHAFETKLIPQQGEARQSSLRLIAEEDEDMIKQSLKAITQKSKATTVSCRIADTNLGSSRKNISTEESIDLEKAQAELKHIPREMLELFGAFLDRRFGQPGKRESEADGDAMEDGGEKELDMVVDMS